MQKRVMDVLQADSNNVHLVNKQNNREVFNSHISLQQKCQLMKVLDKYQFRLTGTK